ncbi:MAG: hypothetical protein E7591_08035 [Ruminococcaceae bacterium]|nr:hypothetical protein [Oscillospiraceae bacterium]
MSSITKCWREEDFRRELKKLDEKVRREKGIELIGAELDIKLLTKGRYYGRYWYNPPSFDFNLKIFNSDIPENCALDIIRHEYAHYYNHVVNGGYGHGKLFKGSCDVVGAEPSTYYKKSFENREKKKEERKTMVFSSVLKLGQKVCHPKYRVGEVISISERTDTAMLEILFPDYGIKYIDELWLRSNGKVL